MAFWSLVTTYWTFGFILAITFTRIRSKSLNHPRSPILIKVRSLSFQFTACRTNPHVALWIIPWYINAHRITSYAWTASLKTLGINIHGWGRFWNHFFMNVYWFVHRCLLNRFIFRGNTIERNTLEFNLILFWKDQVFLIGCCVMVINW